MGGIKFTGADKLNDAFARISDIPFDVTAQALDAMAKVAAEEIRSTGLYMNVYDEESDTHILDSIKPGKAKPRAGGGYEKINFSGSRRRGSKGRRTSNSEIAFLQEYGARGRDGKPFTRTAMTQNNELIAAPGEKIIGDWIENEYKK